VLPLLASRLDRTENNRTVQERATCENRIGANTAPILDE
jgi:hypothetical protein